MNYMTVKEAAEQWGLTPRRICILCSQGRIPNAVKRSKVWMIPAGAEKPADARRTEANAGNPLRIFRGPCPGAAPYPFELNEEEQVLGHAYLLLLRGHFAECRKELSGLISGCANEDCLLIALSFLERCSFCAGDPKDLRFLSSRISTLCAKRAPMDPLANLVFYPPPFSGQYECFIRSLNSQAYEDIRHFLVLSACRRTLTRALNEGREIDTAPYEIIARYIDEGGRQTIYSLYLHLVLAVYYNLTGYPDLCRPHIEFAAQVLLPEKWYTPIAEYSASLDLRFIDEIDHEAYLEITALSERILRNYVRVGFYTQSFQLLTKDPVRVSSVLYQVACRKSTREIADFLGLSTGQVQRIIRAAYAETGLSNRNELRKLVLSHLKL